MNFRLKAELSGGRRLQAEVTWRREGDEVRSMAVSADGERAMLVYRDVGEIYALPTGRQLATFPRPPGIVHAYCASIPPGAIAR